MELNLSKLGVNELNPMQELMLSEYPTHRHIVLLSPTGSGKTLAYLLPLLQTIDSSSDAAFSIGSVVTVTFPFSFNL